MTGTALALLLAAAAMAVIPRSPAGQARRRLGVAIAGRSPPERSAQPGAPRRPLAPGRGAGPAEQGPPATSRARIRSAVGVVGAAALLGGASNGTAGVIGGAALGCIVAVAVDAGARHADRRAARRLRDERAAALPATLDLVASCLHAGTPFVGALEIVAAALPGSLADDLSVVAALHRLGATTSAAWADWADDDVLGPLARAVAASAESGSRLADALERLAADAREEAALAGEAKARQAGVMAMAPLGLCFLPAFACLGVGPVVLGIAAEVVRWR